MSPERTSAPSKSDEPALDDARRVEEAASQDTSLASGRTARSSDAVQLLALQGAAGNRAVTAMVQRKPIVQREPPEGGGVGVVSPESEAPEAEHEQSAGDVPGAVPESASDEASTPPPTRAELAPIIEPAVAKLPEAPDVDAEKALAEGRAKAGEARELGLEGRPALAGFYQNQARDEDGSEPPSKLSQFASYVGGGIASGASYVGKGIAKGATAVASTIWDGIKSIGSGLKWLGSKIHGAVARDKSLDKTKSGEAFNTDRRSRKQAGFGQLAGSKAASAVGMIPKLKLAGVGVKAATTIGQVTGAIGIFFSSIQGALDIRALISSGKQVKNFDQMAKDAVAAGHSPAIVEAVRYAMEQKYSKAIKRAIAVGGGLFSVVAGAGLLAITLASNPVGWFILAAMAGIGAIVGLGMAIYKFARWIKKGDQVGVKRRQMATRLVVAAQGNFGDIGDPYALAAIKELHLDPKVIANEEEAIAVEMVMEKLKSA